MSITFHPKTEFALTWGGYQFGQNDCWYSLLKSLGIETRRLGKATPTMWAVPIVASF